MEEKLDPGLPVAGLADPEQVIDIFGFVTFSRGTEVEQRLSQATSIAEKQVDQKTPDSPIAIEERVDRLELRVDQGKFDQDRHPGRLVDEPFQVVERFPEIRDRRGNKSRVGRSLPRPSDHILPLPKLTGRLVLAPNPLHQMLVNIADESQVNGTTCLDLLQAVLSRDNRVDNFLTVGECFPLALIDLEEDELLEVGDGSLHPA